MPSRVSTTSRRDGLPAAATAAATSAGSSAASLAPTLFLLRRCSWATQTAWQKLAPSCEQRKKPNIGQMHQKKLSVSK